jgi:hypothetical protein
LAPPPGPLAVMPVGSGRGRDLPVVKMSLSRDLSAKPVPGGIVFSVSLN